MENRWLLITDEIGLSWLEELKKVVSCPVDQVEKDSLDAFQVDSYQVVVIDCGCDGWRDTIESVRKKAPQVYIFAATSSPTWRRSRDAMRIMQGCGTYDTKSIGDALDDIVKGILQDVGE